MDCWRRSDGAVQKVVEEVPHRRELPHGIDAIQLDDDPPTLMFGRDGVPTTPKSEPKSARVLAGVAMRPPF